jgi:hypothetical protein
MAKSKNLDIVKIWKIINLLEIIVYKWAISSQVPYYLKQHK